MTPQSQEHDADNYFTYSEITETVNSEVDETGDSTYNEITETAFSKLNDTTASHCNDTANDSYFTHIYQR